MLAEWTRWALKPGNISRAWEGLSSTNGIAGGSWQRLWRLDARFTSGISEREMPRLVGRQFMAFGKQDTRGDVGCPGEGLCRLMADDRRSGIKNMHPHRDRTAWLNGGTAQCEVGSPRNIT